jgi:hypothetical protein
MSWMDIKWLEEWTVWVMYACGSQLEVKVDLCKAKV